MNSMLTVAIIAALAAGPAYAECTSPSDAVQIPSGSSATREQMVAAQQAIKALDAAVNQFADCLKQEQDDKVAAGGDKAKLIKEYARRQNEEVDKLQKIVDKFNVELKAFKAKSAG